MLKLGDMHKKGRWWHFGASVSETLTSARVQVLYDGRNGEEVVFCVDGAVICIGDGTENPWVTWCSKWPGSIYCFKSCVGAV